MTVFFNPDTLIIDNGTEGSETDAGFLKTDTIEGKYLLQLLNLDLQQSHTVTMTIDNEVTDDGDDAIDAIWNSYIGTTE